MRRLLIAATALLLATPAYADWAPTRWGMSVDAVVAAYPGTRAVPHDAGMDINGLHILASGTSTQGGIELNAQFYFDPATHQLGMVRLEPKDFEKCQAWHDLVMKQYPGGKPNQSVIEGEKTLTMTGIEWKRAAGEDGLDYTGAHVSNVGFMAC